MPYDELLTIRIRDKLSEKGIVFIEKRMMGGITFLVDGKMCIGVLKNNLMARIDPEIYEQSLTKKGCKEMDFTGRPMKGFVFVESEGIEGDDSLDYWVELCLDYNPKAKSVKGKKKKL